MALRAAVSRARSSCSSHSLRAASPREWAKSSPTPVRTRGVYTSSECVPSCRATNSWSWSLRAWKAAARTAWAAGERLPRLDSERVRRAASGWPLCTKARALARACGGPNDQRMMANEDSQGNGSGRSADEPTAAVRTQKRAAQRGGGAAAQGGHGAERRLGALVENLLGDAGASWHRSRERGGDARRGPGLERADELLGGLGPRPGVLGQGPHHHGRELGLARHLGRELQQGPGCGAHVLQQVVARVGALEGQLPGQHPVGEDAQRVNVAPAVQRLAHGLLWREVLRRPQHHAHLAQAARVWVRLDEAGDAEVQKTGLLAARPRREDDVFGLQVAVNNPLLMDGRQALGQLHQHAAAALRLQRPGLQRLEQRLPLGQLHDETGALLGLSKVDDADDGRVLDAGQEAGLPAKALAHSRLLADFVAQHLERHLAAETHLLGEVHLAHASAPQVAEHPEAFVEDERIEGEHGA